MNNFRLKSDEMMFFLDFNNTLVDYANEYDIPEKYFQNIGYVSFYHTRAMIAKSLIEFERKTGITPVVCIVTNASSKIIDYNGFSGICNDFFHTFFYQEDAKIPSQYDARRFFKFLVHRENDTFMSINPNATAFKDVFEEIPFHSKALDIRYIEQFKKKESVDRIMSVVDPRKNTSKYIFFAGDSIKDDYPMKEIWTPHGVSKIFIRPGKQKLTYDVMRQFCEAKGDIFESRNPKNGKLIKCQDINSFNLLSPKEQDMIKNYKSGDYVYLTSPNSRGLIEGIEKMANIILDPSAYEKDRF